MFRRGPSMFGNMFSFPIPGATSKKFFEVLTVFSPSLPQLIDCGGTDVELDFDMDLISSLNEINMQYVKNLADKNYTAIPEDFANYLRLYDTVFTFQRTRTNDNLLLLFDITLNGLKGSVESYSLFTQNISLALNNSVLEKRIEDILSGKNEANAMSTATGTLTMTKTFVLAPLFSYYIVIFGMPAEGVGFDPKKLSTVLDILNENGIDPYD